jgi:hypothetical protein
MIAELEARFIQLPICCLKQAQFLFFSKESGVEGRGDIALRSACLDWAF